MTTIFWAPGNGGDDAVAPHEVTKIMKLIKYH